MTGRRDEAAEAALERLIGRFSPDIAALGRALIARMRQRIPEANALVFDTHAFGVGFGPRETASGVFASVVLYPRWASLFFMKGALLSDPARLLRGSGRMIRHVRMTDSADFGRPEVEALIAQALDLVEPPLGPAARGRLVIFSVPGNRRGRRRG